jgi:NitT/TauT family transport system substrate-binding protein
MLDRRSWLQAALAAGLTAGLSKAQAASSDSTLRLGLLQFGTVQWLVEVIRHDGLDRAHGIDLHTSLLANNDAGRVALMAGGADLVVADWLFAAYQRQAGTPLSFAPFSSASGGIMVPGKSPIASLTDLRGRRLGVAGGPADRSWLLVQAAARRKYQLDLRAAANVVYGAPPLLGAKLQQGELDAVLTFWTFAARLEAEGCRQVISVDDCAKWLGLPAQLGLLGFVFHTDWAERRRTAVDGFLGAVADAEQKLAANTPDADQTWGRLRPLMQAPAGPQGDALFAALRRRFVAALGLPPPGDQERVAARVLEVLQHHGSDAAAGVVKIPPGLFWSTTNA